MNRRRPGKGWIIYVLCLSFMVCMLPLFSTESRAATKKETKYGTFVGKAPDTYAVSGETVYFYPKKIYYSGGKVVCYVYVVNKTGDQISALSNVKLTLRNKSKKTVAVYTFKAKKKISIANDKYKTVKYVFPKSAVKIKNFYFKNAKRMSIKASYTYYRP